jgi:hypothetical protein
MIKSFQATDRSVEQGSSRRGTIILFLGIIAFFGWLYFFLFSDFFTVKAVEISGTQRLKRGEVERIVDALLEEQRVWPFRARNLFSIDADGISKRLKNELYIEKAVVDKKYPNILRLKLEERQSTVVVTMQESAFEVDRHGIVTREIGADELASIVNGPASPERTVADMPVLSVTSASGSLPMVDDEFASESQVSRWLDTFETLKRRGFGYRGASIEDQGSTKLVIDMQEPFDVYFDMLSSMDAQIEGYFAFMKVKTKEMAIHEYIDARIPGKIYYK